MSVSFFKKVFEWELCGMIDKYILYSLPLYTLVCTQYLTDFDILQKIFDACTDDQFYHVKLSKFNSDYELSITDFINGKLNNLEENEWMQK